MLKPDLKFSKKLRRKVILYQRQSPGDILTFTRAVADLKLTYPHWLIDVRTPCPEIFENNPHITHLDENDPDVEVYDITYDKINDSGWEGLHFSDAFRIDIEEKLNSNPEKVALYGEVKIKKTGIVPELYISDEEKSWFNQVHCEFFWDGCYWVINAGHKPDNVLKQYHKWQEVVDIFNDVFQKRIVLVQIGDASHKHDPLKGVLNLVGRTDLRQLIRLVYNAHGSVGGISFQFVLSSAFRQPSVVVAGGKEGTRWHIYNWTQWIHTIGALNCCVEDGCWLGGSDVTKCQNLVNGVPRCFEIIPPELVVQAIITFYEGGRLILPTEDDVAKWTKRMLFFESSQNVREKIRDKYFVHDVEFYDGSQNVMEYDIIGIGEKLSDELVNIILQSRAFVFRYGDGIVNDINTEVRVL